MTETTINFKGINLLVQGAYDKGEDSVMYYGDGSGYPGSPPSFDIEFIFIEDSEINIYELFSWDDLEKMQELALEQL